MAKKPALGRGINALIPDSPEDEAGLGGGQRVIQIDLDDIEPNPFQPRTDFSDDQLDELTLSIKEKGVIQPIAVSRVGQKYQLIAGERRWRATRRAGFKTIPAIVHQIESKQELIELSLIENVQRDNLNPIEEAEGYRALIDTCFLTQDEVARKVGRDRSTVANMVRLLRLPGEIQEHLRKEELQMGHARALLAVEEDADRIRLARRAVAEHLTVREVEQLASERHRGGGGRRRSPTGGDKAKDRGSRRDPHLVDLEDRLRHRFGTAVTVRSSDSTKGRIELEFYNEADLERLLDLLLGDPE